ncbi:hypothetical protein [Allocoleopsis sp.]|uniref:hypothetical protein n=1 Tax=Allocoleopsis sp. TaxID=3088169 RepID=UPI002FD76F6F
MSAYLSFRLILGLLLLNVVQIAVSIPTTAQPLTWEPARRNSNVSEITTVKPTLFIAQQSRTRRIQFVRGASSVVVEDAVVRGTRDTYLVGAKVGQKITVSITSVENNAVFDIVSPKQKLIKQEVTSWSTKLSATGDYRIVVGGTRGNATYKLRVETQVKQLITRLPLC